MTTSTQTTLEKKTFLMPNSSLIITGVLALIGIASWIYQLIRGMQVTGLDQQVVWGFYIAAFFTAAGAGAGLLALIGLSGFRPILPSAMKVRLLSLTLASFIIAGLLITMDAGSPLNLWRFIVSMRLNSLMVLDFCMLVISVLITLYYLTQARKAESLQPRKGLSVLAVVFAVALVVVEGLMLSSLAAHPLWGSGITLVSFLTGAAIAGLGLAVLILPKESFPKSVFSGMIILSLVLVLAEVLTGFVGDDPLVNLVLTSPISIFFWFQLILGLCVPLYLLIKDRLAWAGVLAIAGVIAEKVWLLAAGQAQPWMPGPESIYLPSLIELVAVVGMAALGVLLFKLTHGWAASNK